MNIKLLSIALLTASTLGCVTQKKYDSLLAEKVALEADKVNLNSQLEDKTAIIDDLDSQLKKEKELVSGLKEKLSESQKSLDSLQSKYNTLKEYYDRVTSNSGKLSQDLAAKERQLLKIENDLAIAAQKNEELAANLADREAKVAELERILAEKEEAVNALRKKVSEALLNFKENDLTIEVKNGKVYVSLAEQLLFNSGSTVVDPKGVSALKKLAQVLNDNPDVNIVVEGHTDNVPINAGSKYLKDNWDLSVLRATSIVRILVDNGAIPSNITAAGKGEFTPKASNDEAAGRQTNRRTEIILTPKLDELFQILESN